MKRNGGYGDRRGGLLILRIVLAQLILMTLLVGLLYSAGMFDGPADNALDPITGIPDTEFRDRAEEHFP